MFQFLLILKYLRRKLAPMFAALAVTLCTAMVIIVISVMGGFLEMWRDSAKRLSGEVQIAGGLTGVPHYEELLAELRAAAEVESATAIMYTFGILKVDTEIDSVIDPFVDQRVLKVELVGVQPEELDQVVAYKSSLYWTPESIERSREQFAKRADVTVDRVARPGRPIDIVKASERRDLSFPFRDGELRIESRDDVTLWRISDDNRNVLFEGPVAPKSGRDVRFSAMNANFVVSTKDEQRVLTVTLTEGGDVVHEGPMDAIPQAGLPVLDGQYVVRTFTADRIRFWTLLDDAGRVLLDWPIETQTQRNFFPIRSLDENTQRFGWWTRHRVFEGDELLEAGMQLAPPDDWQSDLPGMVAGIVVYPGPRDEKGEFNIYDDRLIGRELGVTVVPLTEGGTLLEQSAQQFIVVNELKSGFMEFDQNRVYVPFDVLQKMLKMDPAVIEDEFGQPTGEMTPARATAILVKSAPGVPLAALKAKVADIVDGVVARHPNMRTPGIQTWEEQHATILSAVEKEKFLLVFLFAIISLVAFVMVATTFYNIVLEKTRDIGVLRALGASRSGIASLFLGYGLAIGVVGAIAGFALAAAVIGNINAIQDWLAESLGQTLFSLGGLIVGVLLAGVAWFIFNQTRSRTLMRWWKWISLGLIVVCTVVAALVVANSATVAAIMSRYNVRIWDAQIYYFDQIPAKMNATEVVVIMISAVLSSIFGSLIPALVASQQDPVESLRYE